MAIDRFIRFRPASRKPGTRRAPGRPARTGAPEQPSRPAARAPLRPVSVSAADASLFRLWGIERPGSIMTTVLCAGLVEIMVLPQGLDYNNGGGMPTEGDAISRFTWLFLLFGGIAIAMGQLRRAMAMMRTVNPYILIFALLAAASILWSITPVVTTRRLIRIYATLAVCLSLTVVGWHALRFQNVVRTLYSLVLIASLIFIYVNPGLAIHWTVGHPELYGAWHGVLTGKNLLGSVASACLLLWVHAWLAGQQPLWKVAIGVAISLSCLLGSHSSTSLMATMFAVMFMVMLLRAPRGMRRYMPYFVALFAAIILIYALAILRLVPGLDAVLTPIAMISGKDLTFTHRTDIWYVMRLHINLRPWFGSGYGAFWVGADPASESYIMMQMLQYYPTEGHNGYLDVINDLGIIGGIVLFAYFVHYVFQALQVMAVDRYQGGLYLALLFRGFLADMSESHWFNAFSIDFVIMTLATFALGRSALQIRLDRAAAARDYNLAAAQAAQAPENVRGAPPTRLRQRPQFDPASRRHL